MDVALFPGARPNWWRRRTGRKCSISRQRRYTSFDASLGKALDELKSAAKKIGLHTKPTLTDMEMTFVAIAYNTGGFNPAKGLKQGFRPKDKNGIPVGLFYGEQTFQFIQTSKTVPVD